MCMTLRNCPNALTSDVRPLKYFISCLGGSLDILLSLPIVAAEMEKCLGRTVRCVCLKIDTGSLLMIVREENMDESRW